MSLRGVCFIRDWSARNVEPQLAHPDQTNRARALAATCREDLAAARIGLQEIEDEVGDLEEAIGRMIEARATAC